MHSSFNFQDWAYAHQQRVELVLSERLPTEHQLPSRLHAAMRYAVLGGGKRVRALLAYAAATLAEAPASSADHAAAAVELIHAFSLIHDDLPCMDNDDLRRGKPSCHKQFDDATALLAGDALQSLAFFCLCEPTQAQALQQVRTLAEATGSLGMCGGQAIDLDSTGQRQSQNALETMHQYKTGALIRASLLLGAYAAESTHPSLLDRLTTVSQHLGLAFQVVDDILDATADSATLGKTAGKDQDQDKSTYVTLLGVSASQALVSDLFQRTMDCLSSMDHRADPLRGLAQFICQRSF